MTVADRLVVMATGAAVAVSIVGGSCSTNARIGDIQVAIRELRLDMRAEHDAIRAEIRRLDDRVRMVEITVGVPSTDSPPADTRPRR